MFYVAALLMFQVMVVLQTLNKSMSWEEMPSLTSYLCLSSDLKKTIYVIVALI